MTTSRRAFLGWTAGLAASALVAACGGGTSGTTTAGSQPRDGGTLIVGQYQEVTQFDPNRQYSWETWRIDRNIYETLVDEDLTSPTGVPKIIPKLATSWEVSDDATTYTFKLRQGVKFSDGTPFDAEAVRFNVRRFTDPEFEYYDKVSAATMSLVYADLAKFEVVDAFTVRYTFEHPFLDFLRQIPNSGNAASGIFSPEALKKNGQDGLALDPVGTGPFTFQERVRGDHTTLVRNPDYWGPRPHLDKVIFKPIGDDQSRVAALRSGEVDFISRVPPDSVQTLEQAGFDVPKNEGVPQIIYYKYNFKNTYLQDRRVRQAIIHAIDRAQLAEKIYKGHAKAATSIINQGNEAYDPAAVDYPYDPEAAKKLIAEAGYEPGEIKFTILSDTTGQPTAEFIQQGLKNVGVDAQIESFEWITFGTRAANLTPTDGLILGEWGYVAPNWVQIAHNYNVAVPGGDKYSDTSGDTLKAIEAAAHNSDPAKAKDLWQEAAQTWAKDATVIPVLSFNRYYAVSPRVGGFVWPQQDHYDLSRVWVAD
ncbi:peptide/nickel transport system substrate-binding protein [Actinocorallia herbida]|uniref:Peptide/nickel transport system substrate-binding protein n=1 Tax=Actinocorallia herbida TaxID=58109 RepID=A0A3N1CX49_9ACTN|nr:ABC transporter substrate-binding protein [Actinocorallia herbida]ROO85872.1 peptide/nickel transport system substrate-binding protein [Actinocorallia herbida]